MSSQKFRNYFCTFVQPTDEEWQDLERVYRIKQLKKGDFLVSAGKVCREMNFLNTGNCRTYNLRDGKEITTNFFFAGSLVSDYSSFVQQIPSLEYIQALTDCEVLYFSYESMQYFYEKYPVMERFGRLIAEKVFLNIYQRQNDLLLLTPKERYLKLLKRRPKVVLNLPQIYIASYLGITPEYLSRLRRELKFGAENSQ
ncbi:MAG: Crp/Fnr family transcriptional regulator [Bacteroidota bacterium]